MKQRSNVAKSQQISRSDSVADLAAAPLDVLVIGGGIVGSGIARDAAMRGLRVGLVEQNDFASGTSSKSSRLLHGGLRYLAQGRVGLVREAGREKRILHKIAPHLAAPLPFIFPTYKGSQWSLTKLRIGVKLYDLLCGTSDYGRTGGIKGGDALALAGIADSNLTGGVRYFDSFTNDARLVLDTLRSAQRHGAIVVNYCKLESATRKGKAWTCTVRDALGDRSLEVQAKTVVNAAGPWAQQVPHSSIKLRLTKGSHLVVSREKLPIGDDAFVLAQGNRILFAIPWGQRIILGTTDTDFTAPQESVRTDMADVNYILEVVNSVFPKARLRPSDILSEWAGLRPLIASSSDKAGHPSNISRKHVIRMSKDGWMDVAGGKLTTYRHIAEQAVNRLVKSLDKDLPKSTTHLEPLVSVSDAEGISGLVPPPVSQSLVEHFCRNEWAQHVDDVMVRRTSWHYYDANAHPLADEVGKWMAGGLKWDATRLQDEMKRYRTLTASVLDGVHKGKGAA